MNEVWRKHGMEVTVNTLYQNISILRKTLKRVGIDENIIITVPKKGITLSAQVEELEDKTITPLASAYVGGKTEEVITTKNSNISLHVVLWVVLAIALFALWTTFIK